MPTQKQIADHLDLSQKQVSELMGELGIDWRNETLERIRVAYIRRLRAAAAGHQASDGSDLVRERVMTERVDRELKELQLAEKRGQLVSLEQLEPELAQMVVAFRSDLLARDDKLKSDLDALYGINVDLQVLNDYTHESLNQLARYDPERAGTATSIDAATGAAAEDDDDGMGETVQTSEPEGIISARPLQP